VTISGPSVTFLFELTRGHPAFAPLWVRLLDFTLRSSWQKGASRHSAFLSAPRYLHPRKSLPERFSDELYVSPCHQTTAFGHVAVSVAIAVAVKSRRRRSSLSLCKRRDTRRAKPEMASNQGNEAAIP